MMTTMDRRHGERARIPCRIPVELTDDTRQGPFEADAVDLSVGGLSLRAPTLPVVGSHLWCSFEAMPGGAQVLGRGEVVWVQPSGDSGGEFGLRFIELEPKAQALIDEMVAERIARIETPFAGREQVVANLEIENVDSPIAAKFVHTVDGEAVFEQPLDLLAIGRAVVAHAGVSLVRGSIARVDLRMDGETPMLALTVRLKQEPKETQRFGEFDWDAASSPDTEPDLLAPLGMEVPDDLTLRTGSPDELERDLPHEVQSGLRPRAEDQLSLGFAQHAHAPIPSEHRTEPQRLQLAISPDGEGLRDAAYDLPLMAAAHAQPDGSGYIPVAVEPHEPHEPHEQDEWAHPLPDGTHKTLLVSVLRVFAGLVGQLQHWLSPLPDALRSFGGDAREHVASSLGRLIAQAKPRRTTSAAPGREPSEHRSTLRLLGLGLMSIAAVALFAYALAPNPSSDIALHRRVTPDVVEDVSAATIAGAKDTQLTAAVAANTAPASAVFVPPQPTAANAVGATTAGSPYAVDVRKAGVANKAKTKAEKLSAPAKRDPSDKPIAQGPVVYGNKQVPNAKHFALRLSAPVTALQGSSDAGGFSIVIPGSFARDRAAPIAAHNPELSSAMIINHKDHAELNVRFAKGKNPAFRVTGTATGLEVLIGQ